TATSPKSGPTNTFWRRRGSTRTCTRSNTTEDGRHEDRGCRDHGPLSLRRRAVVLPDVPEGPPRARSRRLVSRGHRRVQLRPEGELARDRSRLRAPDDSSCPRAGRAPGPVVLHRLHGKTPRDDRGAVARGVRRYRSVLEPVRRELVLA